MSLATALVPLAFAVLGFALWSVRLGRLFGRPTPAPTARPEPWPRVSIIVPARDEAHNLPRLLASVARLDPAPCEVIVVDDHSTDGTGELARKAGVRVVTPPPLPAGWLGKPWACHAGAQAATGDLLLFTDADTAHARDSLGQAVAQLRRDDAGLLSVVPTHVVIAWWERLQGVFQLLLLLASGAGLPPSRARGERRFSIGQYLLFTRAAYERVGGHPAVAHRVAEDLAFARLVAEAGLGFSLLHAPGLLAVRMYPEGLGAFLRGWRRNFREGLASAGPGGVVEMVVLVGWLLGVPLFAAQALAAGALAPALLGLTTYLLTAAEIARRQPHVGRLPAWGALAYPLFVALFVAVTLLALLDRARRAPVAWRGRRLPAPAAR